MKKTNIAAALSVLLLATACKKDEPNTSSTRQYQLVADSSTARWKGFLRTGYFNEGSIGVEGSNIEVKDGTVTGGAFKMPLSSLKNFNLPTDSLKEALLHHLQSADFFDMALHPNVSYEITSVAPYKGGDTSAIAGANHIVHGYLTILGKSRDVSFPAKISLTDKDMQVSGKLKVDRTLWGMNYAADPRLTDDKYILPDMEIELALKGVRK